MKFIDIYVDESNIEIELLFRVKTMSTFFTRSPESVLNEPIKYVMKNLWIYVTFSSLGAASTIVPRAHLSYGISDSGNGSNEQYSSRRHAEPKLFAPSSRRHITLIH